MPVTVPLPIEQRELCKALICQGLAFRFVAQKTGVKEGTIRMWAHREKWITKPNPIQFVTVTRPLTGQSASVRESLATAIERQAHTLSRHPIQAVKQLRNKGGEQGLAATLKTVAEAAAIIFDWRAETKPGAILVMNDARNTADAFKPVTAVECLPEPQPVPSNVPESARPQDAPQTDQEHTGTSEPTSRP